MTDEAAVNDTEQEEEMVVVESIYGEDFRRHGARGGSVRVRVLAAALRCQCTLTFDLGGISSGYPRSAPPPLLKVTVPDFSLPKEAAEVLTQIVRDAAAQCVEECGGCVVARLVEILTDKMRIADNALSARMLPQNIVQLLALNAASGLAPEDGTSSSFVQILPLQSLRSILAWLDGCSLARTAMVCRTFRIAVDDAALWKGALDRAVDAGIFNASAVTAAAKVGPREAFAMAWRQHVASGRARAREKEHRTRHQRKHLLDLMTKL